MLCSAEARAARPEGHVVTDSSLDNAPCLDMTRQLVFKASVLSPSGWQKKQTLVDTGASACFASRRWVEQHGYTTMKTTRPIRLSLADGTEVGRLMDTVELTITHGGHTHQVLCFITNIGKYDIILGMNWTDYHGVSIQCGPRVRALRFESDFCRLNCLKDGATEVIYDKGRRPLSETRTETAGICLISGRAAVKLAQLRPENAVWMEPHHWERA